MIRRLTLLAVLAGVGGMVYKSIPDLARYLKIRQM